jgi:hypothetical protein
VFEISVIPVVGGCAASTDGNVRNRYEVVIIRLESNRGLCNGKLDMIILK